MEPDKFYFEEAKRDWEEFRNLVENGFGPIEKNSKLAQIANEIIAMLEVYLDPSKLARKQDYRSRWRKVCGLNDFVRKVLLAHKLPEFRNIWPLAKNFLDEHSAIVQNDKTEFNDDTANKLFELFIALLLARFATNIKIDTDKRKKGKRPDLSFDFKGMRWAIECKTPSSAKVKAYKDKVLEGVQQIEEFQDPVDRGFVAINMRNAIDHDHFWPIQFDEDGEVIPTFWNDYETAFNNLEQFGPTIEELIEDMGGEDSKHIIAQWKRARPFSLKFYSSCATVLDHQLEPKLGLFRTFKEMKHEPLDSKDCLLLYTLQEALHDRI